MEFPIEFDTVQSRWSIAYIEGSQVIIAPPPPPPPKKILSLKIDFALANSVDPNVMPHYHLGLHCLPKYLFRGVCG